MTAIADIHAGLAALLTSDAYFVADMQALGLGNAGEAVAPGVLAGFRDPRQIHAGQLPLCCIELGDAETEAVTNDGSAFGLIGYTQQDMAADVLIGLIWHQQDHAEATRQRLGLEAAFVDLLLRHPDVGGAITAHVRQIQFDRGALHPTQTAVVTVRVHYSIERTPR